MDFQDFLFFLTNHRVEILIGVISSLVFLIIQSGVVNIIGWIRLSTSKYHNYLGNYFLYSFDSGGKREIVETEMKISQVLGNIRITAKEEDFSFIGTMTITEPNIYIKLRGRHHKEELLYIFPNPLTGVIGKIYGVGAYVTPFNEPCALRFILSDRKMEERKAKKELTDLEQGQSAQSILISKNPRLIEDNPIKSHKILV